MNNLINRSNFSQVFYSNSSAIRQEIQRFEGVHPSIYAIYNLLEHVDPLLAQQIREHVVCVEDSFVNSQEWTLSRSVSDLRLGVVGSPASGKSALVHRYLTGSYMQEESPEGGRFKKEVVIDGQSYLLLIRDEGGPPELQFSCWVDAVILVFSLENELSFSAISSFYAKICQFRNCPATDLPVILVGTQDAISETNPRVIEDTRARKLAADLKQCTYYETCATYGLNVERVFQDACQRIVQHRVSLVSSRPTTPLLRSGGCFLPPPAVTVTSNSNSISSPTHHFIKESRSDFLNHSFRESLCPPPPSVTTPCSTPTTARKNRRKSNIFTPLKKSEDDSKVKNGEVGSGRVIPLRQGYLYKRSNKGLNKEWKKKYVALTTDGMLTYHPSLREYMEDIHGKDIPLIHTTVKVPGQRPRGMGSPSSSHDLAADISNLSLNGSSTHLLGHDTPTTKKRHRRMKSIGTKNADTIEDSDGYEFMIVSLDNKQWQFEAANYEDREAWITAIEQQILSSLSNDPSKHRASLNDEILHSIRGTILGNSHCVDCGAPNPDWASLNLGALMCIECSGLHRNLGSHISRVRSLDLDDWPPEHLAVLKALGNSAANAIWEGGLAHRTGVTKPNPNSSREEKERWIREKYELKLFLAPLSTSMPLGNQLIDAVCRSDIPTVALLLAHATSSEQVNTPVGPRDQRTAVHLAAALGNLVILQLLLWNQADIKILDSDGRSALYYAQARGHTETEEFLRRAGCPESLTAPASSTLPRRSTSSRSAGSQQPPLPSPNIL